jgi:UDP-N-acetylmuramyl pentapeptide synthase
MHIREFLAIEKVERADGDLEQEINGLNLRLATGWPGRLFFAVAGEKTDGHDYIDEAVASGSGGRGFFASRDLTQGAGSDSSQERSAHHGSLGC